MKFRISGADKTTGGPRVEMIEAGTVKDAKAIANERGVMIEEVQTIPEMPPKRVMEYEGNGVAVARPANGEAKTVQRYNRLARLTKLANVVAGFVAAVAGITVFISLLALGQNAGETIFMAVVGGIAGVAVGFTIFVVLGGIVDVLEAIRDIAINSFRQH